MSLSILRPLETNQHSTLWKLYNFLILTECALNAGNVTQVLGKAGIHIEDIRVVAEHLGLSVDAVFQRVLVKNNQEGQVWGELLNTWCDKDQDASWEKLATAVENIPENGVSISQIVREQSGAGAHICNLGQANNISGFSDKFGILNHTGRRLFLIFANDIIKHHEQLSI